MTVLAQKADLSRAMISFIEHEIRNPSLETLRRIACALEIDLGEVMQRASGLFKRRLAVQKIVLTEQRKPKSGGLHIFSK